MSWWHRQTSQCRRGGASNHPLRSGFQLNRGESASRAVAVLVTVAALMGGCTYYQAVPGGPYVPAPASKFDQAWSATLGAFGDQGVRVTREDRASGVIRGARDGIEITANLRTQADGSVRVEMSRSGATGDQGLLDRISSAYDRRMGR